MTEQPFLQKSIVSIVFIFLGIYSVGGLLDAFTNAGALNENISYFLIAIVIIGWVTAEILKNFYHPRWLVKQGFLVKVKNWMSLKTRLFLVGILITLLVPHFIDLTPSQTQAVNVQSQQFAANNSGAKATNSELKSIEELQSFKQPNDDVSQLKIESATSNIIGQDASLVLTTYGYGAIANKDIHVFINGKETSKNIFNQGDYSNASTISLMGTQKELNLKIGSNEVKVKIDDFMTPPYVFKCFKVL